MAFGIFIHRTDSIYDDIPEEQCYMRGNMTDSSS